MNALLDWFSTLSFLQAAIWLLGINALMFVISVAVGELLVRLFRDRRITPPAPPLSKQEVWLSIGCTFLNGLVALAGWTLWRHRWIHVRRDSGVRAIVDVLVLLILMDLMMYVFHRIAHIKWIFPIVHSTHHLYDCPRPLNLFVLNPFEVLGFGALWLIVLMIYPASWTGTCIYLGLNVAFGTIGHLGVEIYPRWCERFPLIRHIGSSTFHAVHHQDGDVNFGFYTDLWDRLFRTIGMHRSTEAHSHQ